MDSCEKDIRGIFHHPKAKPGDSNTKVKGGLDNRGREGMNQLNSEDDNQK